MPGSTIRELLERDAQGARDRLAKVEEMQLRLKEHAPELLDFVAGYIYIGAFTLQVQALWLASEDRLDFFSRALEVVEKLTGETKADLSNSKAGLTLRAEIPLGEDTVDAVTFFRNHDKKCHKVRVTETKVLSLCGEVDESKYDSVEYLEDSDE